MSKITKSARGKHCTVMLSPLICNRDTETTIFAHLNGGGMGQKNEDLFGAYCCSTCHAALDGHMQVPMSYEEIQYKFLEAIIRTQKLLLEDGLIELK